MNEAILLVFVLLLDAISGEPNVIYSRVKHPVVLMGDSLRILERKLNNWQVMGPAENVLRGLLALSIYVLLWVGLAVLVEYTLFSLLPAWLAVIIVIMLASSLMAARSLYDHVMAVATAPGLEEGRAAVAMIVGRDVRVLDDAGVNRAAVESLAENFSDGVVAPAFWFLVAGLPGIVAFKAISTADSMIGYRSEKYEYFGKAAARLDDLANFIPARLTAILFICAGAILRHCNPFGAMGRTIMQAPKHLSPNAGWPEAAMANILSFKLGGPRRYGDDMVEGVSFGAGRTELERTDIKAALRVVFWAFGVMVLGLFVIGVWV